MEKIINRAYIFSLTDRITKPAPYKGPDPLFKLKQRFPAWARVIIFSWINPFYVFFIYRQALRDRKQLNYRMRNPFTVSFMKYCFQEDYSLDLYKYYPEQDHDTIEKYVDNIRTAEGRQSGPVTINIGGEYEVIHIIPVSYEWDQHALKELTEQLLFQNLYPEKYVDVTYHIPQEKFETFDDGEKATFGPYRRKVIGNPIITILTIKKEDE